MTTTMLLLTFLLMCAVFIVSSSERKGKPSGKQKWVYIPALVLAIANLFVTLLSENTVTGVFFWIMTGLLVLLIIIMGIRLFRPSKNSENSDRR